MDNGASSYRRFLEGDTHAFDTILEEYRDSLTFFINRYVRDIDAAEDIAIDVFADLLVHRHRYNFSVSLKTYLFMLGRSRALNHLKRRGRLQMVDLSEVEGTLAAPDDPESALLTTERRRAVHTALAQLPPDMRAAVHLVYFEDLSYAETARVMKKSVKQIDNLLYRAKAVLRTTLAKEVERI